MSSRSQRHARRPSPGEIAALADAARRQAIGRGSALSPSMSANLIDFLSRTKKRWPFFRNVPLLPKVLARPPQPLSSAVTSLSAAGVDSVPISAPADPADSVDSPIPRSPGDLALRATARFAPGGPLPPQIPSVDRRCCLIEFLIAHWEPSTFPKQVHLPSTGVTRFLRYYEPLSATPQRPACPSRASGWTSLPTPRGFPCCVRFPCGHTAAPAPAQRLGIRFAHSPQPCQPSPIGVSGRPAHRPFRGLLGVHSRCGLPTRAVTNS